MRTATPAIRLRRATAPSSSGHPRIAPGSTRRDGPHTSPREIAGASPIAAADPR